MHTFEGKDTMSAVTPQPLENEAVAHEEHHDCCTGHDNRKCCGNHRTTHGCCGK